MNNIRAISNEANLGQADTFQSLVRRNMGNQACSGQERQMSLTLYRSAPNNQRATLAVQKGCHELWNSSVLTPEGNLTEIGYEIDQIYRLFASFRMLGAYRE